MNKDSQIDNTPKMHIQIYSTPKNMLSNIQHT